MGIDRGAPAGKTGKEKNKKYVIEKRYKSYFLSHYRAVSFFFLQSEGRPRVLRQKVFTSGVHGGCCPLWVGFDKGAAKS